MKKSKSINILLFCILIVCVGAVSVSADITIPADTSIGTWNPITRTYTLTTDVNETIVIGESEVILDGNNFSVVGTGSGDGIYMLGGSFINRTNVTVKNINIDNFYHGIYPRYSSYITIENNTITNCPEGIFLVQANNNQITGNSVSGSIYHAIYLNESENNTIVNNTLADSRFGTYFGSHSHNNTVYNNDFIDNTDQALVVNSSGNIFNLPEPTGGNHFSDWTGPDNDSNGFVDFPYVFTGGQDNLPFVVESAWVNKPPIADAGIDQFIIEIGTIIYLDGSQSYDPDGDPISYQWTILDKPSTSTTELSDIYAVNPTFEADVHGEYTIQLIVSDPYISSEPDEVVISFDNVKPVADAGDNRSVLVGETAVLDGSASFDANFDLLTYQWTLELSPEGSLAVIDSSNSPVTSLTTDLPGEYLISLVVNDGFVYSDPSIVSVMAVTNQQLATQTLMDVIEIVNLLEPENLKNKNMKNTLTNKINQVLEMIEQGLYFEAYNKLNNDIIKKTNGCAENGSPDKNDWITTCEGQAEIYPLLMEAIGYLESILE